MKIIDILRGIIEKYDSIVDDLEKVENISYYPLAYDVRIIIMKTKDLREKVAKFIAYYESMDREIESEEDGCN